MGSESARLILDADALRTNYARIKEQVGPRCAVAGIVKADGYGLGAEPVARILFQQGCRQFFVATPEEGVSLRAALPPEASVAVLGGLYTGAEREYVAHDLTPVLNTLEEAGRWARIAPGASAILHIDTGMNRLGLDGREMVRLAEDPSLLCGVPLSAVMSHFACADDPSHPMTAVQNERFATLAARFPGVPRSLANSAGAFSGSGYHYDMVRPGIALYGGAPLEGRENPMRPVVGLEARVLQVRTVRKGETLGYGATHRFERDGFSATVALGYADGYLRSGSGRGSLYWKGRALPVAGRVSMDLVTLDCTAIPENDLPVPGDFVEVIGPHRTLDQVAGEAGTISYEILTDLGVRYLRIWK
ncbi:MAG TPA: alanine racemase [Alphaproteobacteria bacterium]|nr:alanine racemase [Alphaproteobacteria bacterium]